MSVDDDLKAAELELKRLEIQEKQRMARANANWDLARASVLVTVVAGVAAVLFQVLSFQIAQVDKRRADATAKSDKERAQIAATSDFNFRGVELFVKEHERLVTCDAEESRRNIALFRNLFSVEIMKAFDEIVAFSVQKCISDAANREGARAKTESKTPAQVTEAAEAARYQETAIQAAVLATSISQAPGYQIFIHITKDADRERATALQAELRSKGYSAPGVQKVSFAPERFQVRYYYQDQVNDAKMLRSIAAAQLGISTEDIQLPDALDKRYKSLPKRTMEFWFPRDTGT
jgi:hypothetical protein